MVVAPGRPAAPLSAERVGKAGDQPGEERDLAAEPLLAQPEQQRAQHRQRDVEREHTRRGGMKAKREEEADVRGTLAHEEEAEQRGERCLGGPDRAGRGRYVRPGNARHAGAKADGGGSAGAHRSQGDGRAKQGNRDPERIQEPCGAGVRDHCSSCRISGHPCCPGARLASHQGPEYGRNVGLFPTPESGRGRGYRGFVSDVTPAWIDLLDATREQIENAAPGDLHPRAIDLLVRPLEHTDEPRPTLESHGDYVFGVLLVPHFDQAHTDLYYQEIDLVLTRTCILTVRKTPEGREPFDPSDVKDVVRHAEHEDKIGMIAYHLVDAVAEHYLDLTDRLNDAIDDLEDHVEDWQPTQVRERISFLRHGVLLIRRTLAPTRDAIRRIIDNRIDLDGEELFDHDIELHFADAFDKLLRASEALDLSRDLIAGVRDYHQAKVANDQNEVMKVLTVIAAVLLLPTFIVGLYGQNFADIPELRWHYGYAYVWVLILVTTGVQLWIFRRKGWI